MSRRWRAALIYFGLVEDPNPPEAGPTTRAQILTGVLGVVVGIAVFVAVEWLLGGDVDLLEIVSVVAAVAVVSFTLSRRRGGGS